MSDNKPEFLHELNVRRHAAFNGIWVLLTLALFIVFWKAPHFVEFHSPNAVFVWRLFLVVIGIFTFLGLAFLLLPMAIRGGTYRVVVAEGWLEVESPNWVFGESFKILISSITKLQTRANDETSRHCHIIETDSGAKFRLDAVFTGKKHVPADKLFDVIRALRPDVFVENIRD